LRPSITPVSGARGHGGIQSAKHSRDKGMDYATEAGGKTWNDFKHSTPHAMPEERHHTLLCAVAHPLVVSAQRFSLSCGVSLVSGVRGHVA
jgi:hypothetical protein